MKKGRKKTPLPQGNILNPYDIECLTSSNYFLRAKALHKLFQSCSSISVMKTWLDTYCPIASRDRKLLRKYLRLYEATKEAIDVTLAHYKTNTLITRQELEELVFNYTKKKLAKCVFEPRNGTINGELMGLYIIREQKRSDENHE